MGEGISLTSKVGGFPKTTDHLQKLRDGKMFDSLDKFGREGASALAGVTPVATSLTANSWTYELINENGVRGICWRNTHMAGGTPVVILLQYGHGTGTGGFVEGHDFINPIIIPLFERIREDVRKAVRST